MAWRHGDVFAGFCPHERLTNRRGESNQSGRGLSLIVTHDCEAAQAAVFLDGYTSAESNRVA